MDRKTGKLPIIYEMNYPMADTGRISICSKERGRRFIPSECTFKIISIGLEICLRGKSEKPLRQLYYLEERKKLYYAQEEERRLKREIQMQDVEAEEILAPVDVLEKLRRELWKWQKEIGDEAHTSAISGESQKSRYSKAPINGWKELTWREELDALLSQRRIKALQQKPSK